MLIGLEVELHSKDEDQYHIRDNNGLSFLHFKEFTDGIGVKMSEEYYSHTVEYNFTPFQLNKDTLDECRHFLGNQMEEWNLGLSDYCPSFVGTHIHIFDDSFYNIRRTKLLKGILRYLSNNLDGLEKNSLYRLMLGHQLWTYYCYHQLEGGWKNKLNEYGIGPEYYVNNKNRAKYSPIIKSLARENGKPRSLEIRIIPNEYLFNGKLYELLSLIESREIYDLEPLEVGDFIDIVASKLNLNKTIPLDVSENISTSVSGSMPEDSEFFSTEDDFNFVIGFYNRERNTVICTYGFSFISLNPDISFNNFINELGIENTNIANSYFTKFNNWCIRNNLIEIPF